MTKAVFCITQSLSQTESIVNYLKLADFSNDDISVLFSHSSTTQDFAHEKQTKASEGAVLGGTAGLGIGAMLGWLAGLGRLAIPGLGLFMAARSIIGAISGAAVGVATGGLTGAFIGVGIPAYEAKRYEGKLTGGSALISVRATTSDERDIVKKIFERALAEDISTTGETSVIA